MSDKQAIKPRPPKPVPPIVAWEDITASCGHAEKFGHFADKQDKFRAARREKAIKRPCKACREKAHQQVQEKAKKSKAVKEKIAVACKDQGRLPDGAAFDIAYDASRKLWVGTLAMGETTFTDTGATEFRLCGRLDKQYRKSLVVEQPAEEVVSVSDV